MTMARHRSHAIAVPVGSRLEAAIAIGFGVVATAVSVAASLLLAGGWIG